MPIVVNTNTIALNAQRHLTLNNMGLTKTMERLASGYRINRASDDAAGLQLSETLRSQIRGSQKALDNTQDGINVLNIADGAYQVMEDNIQRIRELTVQAANDTYAAPQRSAIAQEIDTLIADIDRIANSTDFNGVSLLSATAASATGFYLQVGANNSATNDRINLATALGSATTASIGLTAASVASNTASQTYLGVVDTALRNLNSKRAGLGGLTNRLESAAKNLMISIENLSASESRIRNVDVAAESSQLVRNQVLQNASASILTQANQVPGIATKLLGG